MNNVSNVCFFACIKLIFCLNSILSILSGHAEDMLTPICVFPHLEDMQNVDHHCIFLKVGRRYWQNSNRKEDRKLT